MEAELLCDAAPITLTSIEDEQTSNLGSKPLGSTQKLDYCSRLTDVILFNFIVSTVLCWTVTFSLKDFVKVIIKKKLVSKK